MAMLDENGEKMACDPCIRGHRVSGCNHKDRELKHVAKKGRPVSQCTHCRNLRRNRSSHVKCECGDKGHKAEDCPHLAEIKLTEHVCCCSHGKRCTCALKKDPNGIAEVPEEDGDGEGEPGGCCSAPAPPVAVPVPVPVAKPRLSPQHSEPHTTIFANGHHKPVHNKNHEAIHNRAQPYRIPRPHSIHGHHGLTHQRSMDHMRLAQTQTPYSPAPFDLPEGQYAQHALHVQERNAKSENVSPAPYGRQRSRTLQNPNLQAAEYNAFDLSSPTSPMFPNMASNQGFMPSLNTGYSMGDDSQPLSAVSDAHVDWSHYGLNGSQYYGGVQDGYMAAPTSVPHMQRTASSSGAISEYDYQPQYAVSNPGYSESAYAQSNADVSRPDLFRVESTQSFVHHQVAGAPQASYFPDTSSNLSLPPGLEMGSNGQVPGSTTSLSEIDRSSSGNGSPNGDINGTQEQHQSAHHHFSVQDCLKLAHPSVARTTTMESSYDGLNHPASPWSHEVHGEILPTFHPADEVVGNEEFETGFDESAWNVVGH